MRLQNQEVLFSWPLQRHELTAGYYYKGSDNSYTKPHRAIDLRCTWNGTTIQPVVAAEDGKVDWVQQWDGHSKTGNQSYGNLVRIEHMNYKGGSLKTLYAHLSSTIVKKGQTIKEGQIIGYTGNTGNSSGAHLHFEVIWKGVRRNPLCWLDNDFKAASGYQPYTFGPGESSVARPKVNTYVKGIDISKHQNTFDGAKAKNNGITSVIARAAYGTSKDIRFDTFAEEAKKLPYFGTYIFLTYHYADKNRNDVNTARNLMREQINNLLNILKDKKINGWVALDQELESGHSMGLNKVENTALLNEAAELLREAGYSPCIYCSASWVDSKINKDEISCPFWLAYYYADPNDPDFDKCADLNQLDTRWGKFMASLGDKLCAWQFGRIDYGYKYGVGSSNIDRNIIYYQPEEKGMTFKKIKNKVLVVISAQKPACQAFKTPNINDQNYKNLPLGEFDIVAIGDNVNIGGMAGTWVQIKDEETPYVLVLPDRCKIEERKMKFTSISDKQLKILIDCPKTQVFSEPDVDEVDTTLGDNGYLAFDEAYPIIKIGEKENIGGMDGVWYIIEVEGKETYCLQLPDRSIVQDVIDMTPIELSKPIEPIKPIEPTKKFSIMISNLTEKQRKDLEATLLNYNYKIYEEV